MTKQLVKHVEWKPVADGRCWFAKVDGRVYGYVKRLRSGRYESKTLGARNFLYFDSIHAAGRHVVADANYMYPGQLPR